MCCHPSPFSVSAFHFPEHIRSQRDDDDGHDHDSDDDVDDDVIIFTRQHIVMERALALESDWAGFEFWLFHFSAVKVSKRLHLSGPVSSSVKWEK